MTPTTGRFRRSDRVRDPRDFRRVSREGRRISGRAFVVVVAASGPGAEPGAQRLGLSASRRVGNAVVRNRVKRGVREWFRRRRAALPLSLDLVVIARGPAAQLGSAEIGAELDGLARRIARSAVRSGTASNLPGAGAS
ncbi:MAG TPA: ribonuclease P protein component [Planctomycetota bacterium]|nr:ribonuclease P protein component [Planctomycetota bacterium]